MNTGKMGVIFIPEVFISAKLLGGYFFFQPTPWILVLNGVFFKNMLKNAKK